MQEDNVHNMHLRLERLRVATAVTWVELAAELGVSRSLMNQLKSGKTTVSPKMERKLRSFEVIAGLRPGDRSKEVLIRMMKRAGSERRRSQLRVAESQTKYLGIPEIELTEEVQWFDELKSRWRRSADHDEIRTFVRYLWPKSHGQIIAWLSHP